MRGLRRFRTPTPCRRLGCGCRLVDAAADAIVDSATALHQPSLHPQTGCWPPQTQRGPKGWVPKGGWAHARVLQGCAMQYDGRRAQCFASSHVDEVLCWNPQSKYGGASMVPSASAFFSCSLHWHQIKVNILASYVLLLFPSSPPVEGL